MLPGPAEKLLRTIALVIVFGAVTQTGSAWGQPQPSFLEFIYIDATAGEAAAGHSAVKLGETVFHYQFNPNGLLLLDKQNWEDFRYYYNLLSNRSLKVAAIPLSRTAYLTIRQSFQEHYIRQEIDLAWLGRMEKEYQLYINLARGDRQIKIETLGLFSPEPQTGGQPIVALKKKVEEELGAGFLSQLSRETEQLIIQTGKDLLHAGCDGHELSSHQKNGLRAVRLKELLALGESLEILLEGKGLRSEALVQLKNQRLRINEQQRLQLTDFQQHILQSILSLLRTNRSDKGPSLLVQIARYLVIEHSLAEGELVTLYPYAKYPEHNNNQNHAREKADHNYRFLLKEAVFFSERTRQTFFTAQPPSRDIAYSMLEKTQGRLLLYEQAEGEEPNWESFPERVLPYLGRRVPLEFFSGEVQPYQTSIRHAQESLANYRQQLSQRYGYNLVSRNCATELIQTINTAFNDENDIRDNLGGYLRPGDGLSYVPFGLHDAVLASFPIQHQDELPAYRLRELERLYHDEGDEIWFREANTFTSTLYTPWDKDGYFLFFTDNALVTRPFLGLANLCYGALQTVGGMLTAPVDKGERFVRGLDGMIFSLPEILFFNIRKGSFQVIETRTVQ